jgi:hypothetical protein
MVLRKRFWRSLFDGALWGDRGGVRGVGIVGASGYSFGMVSGGFLDLGGRLG